MCCSFFNPERPYSGYATDTYCLSLLVVDLSVGALPCLQLSFAATPAYDILGLLGPLACNFSSVRNMNEMPASSWIVCPRTEVQIGILKHYSPIVRCRHGKCDMALDHGLTIREVNMFERADGPAYEGLSKLQSEFKRPLAARSMAQWQTSLILSNSTVGLRMNSFLLNITRRCSTMLLQWLVSQVKVRQSPPGALVNMLGPHVSVSLSTNWPAGPLLVQWPSCGLLSRPPVSLIGWKFCRFLWLKPLLCLVCRVGIIRDSCQRGKHALDRGPFWRLEILCPGPNWSQSLHWELSDGVFGLTYGQLFISLLAKCWETGSCQRNMTRKNPVSASYWACHL